MALHEGLLTGPQATGNILQLLGLLAPRPSLFRYGPLRGYGRRLPEALIGLGEILNQSAQRGQEQTFWQDLAKTQDLMVKRAAMKPLPVPGTSSLAGTVTPGPVSLEQPGGQDLRVTPPTAWAVGRPVPETMNEPIPSNASQFAALTHLRNLQQNILKSQAEEREQARGGSYLAELMKIAGGVQPMGGTVPGDIERLPASPLGPEALARFMGQANVPPEEIPKTLALAKQAGLYEQPLTPSEIFKKQVEEADLKVRQVTASTLLPHAGNIAGMNVKRAQLDLQEAQRRAVEAAIMENQPRWKFAFGRAHQDLLRMLQLKKGFEEQRIKTAVDNAMITGEEATQLLNQLEVNVSSVIPEISNAAHDYATSIFRGEKATIQFPKPITDKLSTELRAKKTEGTEGTKDSKERRSKKRREEVFDPNSIKALMSAEGLQDRLEELDVEEYGY